MKCVKAVANFETSVGFTQILFLVCGDLLMEYFPRISSRPWKLYTVVWKRRKVTRIETDRSFLLNTLWWPYREYLPGLLHVPLPSPVPPRRVLGEPSLQFHRFRLPSHVRHQVVNYVVLVDPFRCQTGAYHSAACFLASLERSLENWLSQCQCQCRYTVFVTLLIMSAEPYMPRVPPKSCSMHQMYGCPKYEFRRPYCGYCSDCRSSTIILPWNVLHWNVRG